MTKPVKVTINQTEMAKESASKAKPQWTVTDELGRVIEVKKPSLLARLRLMDAIGAESSANEGYVNICAPLMFLKSIDGEVIDLPKSKLQIEALIQTLDNEGMAALLEGIATFIGVRSESDDSEKIKN